MGKKRRVVVGVPNSRVALNARSPRIENGLEPAERATFTAEPGGEVALATFIFTNLGWRGLGRLLVQLIAFFLEHQERRGQDGIENSN